MSFPYYQPGAEQLKELPSGMTLPLVSQTERAKTYQPNPDLIDAVNVAILLGQPLLLDGRAGNGKNSVGLQRQLAASFRQPRTVRF